ncbi:transposase (ISH9) [Haloferax volcanii DS2]|uniref:Transposase (ISH9) n=1 Tax=Haloferax volcanii (strain ATCC 29605 / DSM 3757 / JCM 8879 / NBRC 14742 / NCIMB 2012 / VKM B-1768 / DS2) TaxID=309800 RepID=L9V733_HALVD|nr:transposase (ISH9) [Haloferax volcanii DS2]
MSKISRFTKKAVTLAKNVVGGRGEVAAPEEGGGFADYALLSLHCLRIYLDESYCNALDLLSEMPHICGEIGLAESDLPDHSTLVKAFNRFQMKVCRVLLRLSSELHDLSGHAAIDATFFDRENASKHYCRRTNHRVQTLKATALVDTESQAVLDVHCATEKTHDMPPKSEGQFSTVCGCSSKRVRRRVATFNLVKKSSSRVVVLTESLRSVVRSLVNVFSNTHFRIRSSVLGITPTHFGFRSA